MLHYVKDMEKTYRNKKVRKIRKKKVTVEREDCYSNVSVFSDVIGLICVIFFFLNVTSFRIR